VDEPTEFTFNNQVWTPSNYQNEYDGPITLRRALAHSRNIATIKLAESIGFDNVAALWKRFGIGTPPKGYRRSPSGSSRRRRSRSPRLYDLPQRRHDPAAPLARTDRRRGQGSPDPDAAGQNGARKDTTFLVTNMMRSVLNEGTAAGARGQGFTLDAAGKTGTTNDLRDAWFVGFTPDLLTVVWVGLDDNQPIGLSGAQAALPIWTPFMVRALAGYPARRSRCPRGSSSSTSTRKRASSRPGVPEVFRKLPRGTEPTDPAQPQFLGACYN
jgi:membrane carboxypeptidase/penicillin-binding protein